MRAAQVQSVSFSALSQYEFTTKRRKKNESWFFHDSFLQLPLWTIRDW